MVSTDITSRVIGAAYTVSNTLFLSVFIRS